jgi:hypothetical protein
MNETNKRMALARATDCTSGNKMNISIKYNANAGLNDLNESMISTVLSVIPQDLNLSTMLVTQETIQTCVMNPTYITNLEATMEHNSTAAPSTTNIQSPVSIVPGRVVLVDNESPANPNDVETFALRLCQYSTGTRIQMTPTIPKVSQEYIHIGYYDVKVRVKCSNNPWEELFGPVMEDGTFNQNLRVQKGSTVL